MSKLRTNETYYVLWNDASFSAGNWLENGTELELSITESVGFLIKKDKHKIILAQNRNKDSVGQLIAIPKKWIKNIVKLGTIS